MDSSRQRVETGFRWFVRDDSGAGYDDSEI